jgi:hypothetical protein
MLKLYLNRWKLISQKYLYQVSLRLEFLILPCEYIFNNQISGVLQSQFLATNPEVVGVEQGLLLVRIIEELLE